MDSIRAVAPPGDDLSSAPQHTPGPWIVTHVPTSAGSAFRIGQPGLDKGCAWIYADQLRIGIDDNLPRAIELAANARLIAAAPDLLAALIRCEASTTNDAVGQQARAAIAKATKDQA